jgi:hypothetical protein
MRGSRFNLLGAAVLALAAFTLLEGNVAAAKLAAHAPSLSVYEDCYGMVRAGNRHESIQGLEIRLVSYSTGTPYQVQCFFLKSSPGESPVIDDTVIFDVVNPHANYIVLAKPISLPGAKKKSSPGGKSSKKSPAGVPSSAKDPREGFVVRVLSGDEVLRQHCSTHALEILAKGSPQLLDEAVKKKSARHVDAVTLLKH